MLAASLALAGAGTAWAADATGKWVGDVKLPNGQALPFVAHLQQSAGAVSGKLDGINGAPDVVIMNGKAAGDVVTFEGVRQVNGMPVKFAYTGKLAGDAIDFDIVRADGQAAPLKSHTVRTAE